MIFALVDFFFSPTGGRWRAPLSQETGVNLYLSSATIVAVEIERERG